MNARMLVEFVDGSKTMIEMVAIANATGLVPDVPGMHGPTATLEELARCALPKAGWRRSSRKGWSIIRSARAWRPACSASSKPITRACSSA